MDTKTDDKTETRAVEIRAEIRQIKTMVDGTVNVTLNLPEWCKPQIAVMLEWIGSEIGGVLELTDGQRSR